MKTQDTQKQKSTFKTMSLLGLIVIALFTFNATSAQTKTQKIKGVVSDSYGPLPEVNIVLKGTNTGTTTNNKGEFTFPKTLNIGDILIVSYLGYQKQNIEIKENTPKINLILTEEMIQIIGSLDRNIPYKSNRKNNTKKK